MNKLTESIVTIAVAIIGLATLAVIVSKNANTSRVIDSASKGFMGSLATAISPVTGGSGGMGGFPNSMF